MDAIVRLDSLRSDINAGKFTFEEVVGFISQDKDTRYNHGIMVNNENGSARFEMSKLPQEVAIKVDELKPGEISEPFVMIDPKLNREVVAIVKLTNRIEGHKANIGDDFQLIKDMYEMAESERLIREWLQNKIDRTYVRIEDGWRNCEFIHSGWIKERSNEN